ncbi:MAG: hypothetical protein LAO24_01015 [Acidobacteriia bacterium]|nr:hypothetical protein [Terriglobia bacterium]
MKANKGTAVVALILCMTISFTACSTDWVGQAQEIVAVLVPAATNVVALVAALEGKSVSAQDLRMIQNAGTQASGDLQLILALITQYQKADESTKPAILNKIQTAIGTVQANLESLLPALHIKDAATQAKITAVVGIVLSEVQSLAAIVPLVSASPPTLAAKSAARTGHPKAPLTAGEFVASYNATMRAKTGKPELDRVTAGLGIHGHGKVARVVSAGVLK